MFRPLQIEQNGNSNHAKSPSPRFRRRQRQVIKLWDRAPSFDILEASWVQYSRRSCLLPAESLALTGMVAA